MEKWRLWQRKVAKLFDGIINIKSKDRDVVTADYYIECKQTDNDGFTINVKIWDKIHWDALRAGVSPLIAINLQDRELVVCNLEYFLQLLMEGEFDGRNSISDTEENTS